jgi:hypothetical protein
MTFGIMGQIRIYGPGKWSRLMRYAAAYMPRFRGLGSLGCAVLQQIDHHLREAGVGGAGWRRPPWRLLPHQRV